MYHLEEGMREGEWEGREGREWVGVCMYKLYSTLWYVCGYGGGPKGISGDKVDKGGR